MPMHPYQVPIQCANPSRSDDSRMPIQCQSDAHQVSVHLFESYVNLMPIWCQADANASLFGADPVPTHPGLTSIQCQSSVNQVHIKCPLFRISCQSGADPMPIQYQSGVNQTPIHPNPIPILYQSNAKSVPIDHPSANPIPDQSAKPICQSMTNPLFQCQSYTNLPIHYQSADSTPI